MSVQILIVDDEPDFCSNIADILGDVGYGVDVAYRGLEAIELAKQRPYDLLLLDYKLPCMVGTELYKRLKEAGNSIPALLVTAHAAREVVEEAAATGISTVMEKPVDISNLLSEIEQKVGGGEAELMAFEVMDRFSAVRANRHAASGPAGSGSPR